MAKFHFDLVGPEKLLFSGEVDQVDIPGSEGDFGVLAGHAPLVAMLRPGILTIHADSGPVRAMVTGGFAEVSPDGLTVLADFAMPADEVDRDVLAGQIKDLQEDVTDAAEGAQRDKLQHKLDQLKAVQTALGH
jgi:F-type H+-transporting ATPase subunit epsilon